MYVYLQVPKIGLASGLCINFGDVFSVIRNNPTRAILLISTVSSRTYRYVGYRDENDDFVVNLKRGATLLKLG